MMIRFTRWLAFSVLAFTTLLTSSVALAAEIEQRAPSVRDLSDAITRVSEERFYVGKQLLVSDSSTGITYNADVEGEIRVPLDGDGPFPVVLYLHGRHSSCEVAGQIELLSPECDIEEPRVIGQPIELLDGVESYQGYDYMSRNLVAHGYVVVSIDANDVNTLDTGTLDAGVQARAQLILHHLDILREVNESGDSFLLQDPYVISELRGKIDMSRIGIMGHSRGGQAVTHALITNRNRPATTVIAPPGFGAPFNRQYPPHELTAVFALAPTNFQYINSNDAHFAVLLPYCDGDVSNLQGAFMFDYDRDQDDVGKEKFQIMPMGSNHNFYNTIWTGDDYSNSDAWCDLASNNTSFNGMTGRSIPKDQQRHGEFMMTSFFRLFVGGEEKFAPFWYGNQSMPVDACPVALEEAVAAGELTEEEARKACDDRFHLSVMRTGENRKKINFVTDAASLTTNDLGGDVVFTGEEGDSLVFCAASTTDGNNGRSDADGCPGSGRLLSTAGNMLLTSTANASITQTLQDTVLVAGIDEAGNPTETTATVDFVDGTKFDSVTFRVATPIDVETEATLKVVLGDSSDAVSNEVNVADFSRALFLPPGDDDNSEGAKSLFNMVKLPLAAFEGVNLAELTELTVTAVGPTKLHLTDFMFQMMGNEAPEKTVSAEPSVPVAGPAPAPTPGVAPAPSNGDSDSGEPSTGDVSIVDSSTSAGGAMNLLVLVFMLIVAGISRRKVVLK